VGQNEVIFISVEFAVYLYLVKPVCELLRHFALVAAVHVSIRAGVFVAKVARVQDRIDV
jgi:hypothetical protein